MTWISVPPPPASVKANGEGSSGWSSCLTHVSTGFLKSWPVRRTLRKVGGSTVSRRFWSTLRAACNSSAERMPSPSTSKAISLRMSDGRRSLGSTSPSCVRSCIRKAPVSRMRAYSALSSGSVRTSMRYTPLLWFAAAVSAAGTSAADVTCMPSNPYARASATKSGDSITSPDTPSKPKCTRPRRLLLKMTYVKRHLCCLAVASSPIVICAPPSPAMATTRRSGRSSEAAIAAGSA
mmetsp:Transcript_7209/g.18461  ORF Transcript_7209/g.18461 Transcript_7209/m.18461 type:complete len:236 (+) Transcript_7209:795-1502(+)